MSNLNGFIPDMVLPVDTAWWANDPSLAKLRVPIVCQCLKSHPKTPISTETKEKTKAALLGGLRSGALHKAVDKMEAEMAAAEKPQEERPKESRRSMAVVMVNSQASFRIVGSFIMPKVLVAGPHCFRPRTDLRSVPPYVVGPVEEATRFPFGHHAAHGPQIAHQEPPCPITIRFGFALGRLGTRTKHAIVLDDVGHLRVGCPQVLATYQ